MKRFAALASLLLLATALLAAACATPRPEPVTPADPETAAPSPAEAAVTVTPPAPPDEVPTVEVTPPVRPADAPPAAELPAVIDPLRLRIGLASDLDRVELPCCRSGGRLEAPDGLLRDGASSLSVGVAPAPGIGDRAVYRLQVAALRDDLQAAELARQLTARWGWPADSHFDAGVGLYRVRLGRFSDRPTAEGAERRLTSAGESEAWIVSEGGALRDPGFTLTADGRSHRVDGRWLRLRGAGVALAWDDRRYRGDLLVYLNPRGSLNLINELDLEDYLRGVVPAEMGPALYPRIEALKAQAVAARTYTLRNLGGFAEEGYDLCATPRCQVYAGFGGEHPLSDRAVAETAGQVLLAGDELVDARYSATCGGHTEDVAVVFPKERARYLAGVPCIEAGGTAIEGSGLEGARFPDAVTRALLPPPAGVPEERTLAVRLDALASAAGLPGGSSARPASSERRDLVRWVADRFDLALGPRVLLAADDLGRLTTEPPTAWSAEERRQATLLVASGLYAGPEGEEISGAAAENMLFALARLAGVLRGERIAFRSIADAAGGTRHLHALPAGTGGERSYDLPADLPTFRRRGTAHGAAYEATDLSLAPGDPLTLWWSGERPVALVQEVDPVPVADAPHPRSIWSRWKSRQELAQRIDRLYPGFGFTGFEVLSRGVSGRVGAVRLEGRGGKSTVVEGLAVRWTLDLPDTRFSVESGTGGWRFTGTGWGHGVGLCQTGSFAMAGRGLGYRDILRHYYTGVRLVRARPRPAGAATTTAR
ncbi:MAG TPA: SpoIID/LytB domain-containing protein [Thermoanaerobaculia bacterium]|nr:SpoIID/LytB domain-containing protein [Thermoanaerobaculia bacterium]